MSDSHLQAALDAAEAAAAAIRPHFRSRLEAELKPDQSPVTLADRAAEEAMRALLSRRFPEYGIIGEEQGSDRPGAEWSWVLDPIDGTRAFLTGRPIFGTLIALLHQGRPVLGVLDQPISGERWVGRAGHATSFHGPSAYGSGRPPRTRACAALGQAELSCTAPEIFTPGKAAAFARLQSATRRTTWGGDCYAYGLLALGGIDIVAEAGMNPWDWAALVPIVEGAGGCMTTWSGSALTLGSDGTVLALGNPALLDPALSLLQEKP